MPFTRMLFVLRTVIAVCAGAVLPAAAFGQPVVWTGGGDGVSWNQAANWSPAAVPGSTNDVTIPAGAGINLNVGGTIRSLTTDRAVTQTSGCSLFTITNGLTFTSATGSLSTGNSFCESLRFQGTQAISGPGQLIIRQGSVRVSGAGTTLTVSAGATVQESSNTGIALDASTTLVNSGLMRSSASGQVLTITGAAGSVLTNAAGGVVEASSSGTFVLTGSSWSNAGTLTINGGAMSLGGTFNALGTVSRTGGTLTITGTYTGPTLTATAATGVIGFNGVTLTGTVLDGAGGPGFTNSGGITLNGVTLNAPFNLSSSCSQVTISNGLTFGAGGGGSITTGGSFCGTLFFSGSQTVGGPGVITLGNGSASVTGAGVLTFGPGAIFQTATGSASIDIGAGSSITNQGTFRSNAAGRLLTVDGAGSFTNAPSGTVEASTGSLTLSPASWTNNGTFVINGGTLTLEGTYAALGNVSRTGGTLTLSGTYTGPILTANAITGPLNLGAFNAANTLLNALDGQGYTQGGSLSFSNVTLGAPLTMANSCQTLTITNGLTFGAGGSIATGGSFCQTLVFSGTQTIGGTGTISINAGSSAVSGTNAVVTFGPGVIVQAGNNSASINVAAGCSITNQGTFRVNAASRTLSVDGNGSFTNAPGATVEATTGTFNLSPGSWVNNGTLLINGGTMNLSGTYASLGTVNRTGGSLNLGGSFTGSSLTANAATGSLTLGSNLNLTNVTLGAADGQGFGQNGSITFNNVTLNSPFTMQNGCSTLTIINNLTMGAGSSISTGGSFCQTLIFNGSQNITGVGTISLNAGSSAVTGTGATVTFGPGIIVQAGGANGSMTITAGNTVVNQGVMRANVSSRVLSIDGSGTLTNAPSGSIEASSSGTFNLNSSGTTLAWSNLGTLTVNAGTLNLGGTCSGLGTISRTGGTITFSGIYTGPTFTISNATGPINLAGGTTFNGTTLSAIDGQSFALSGAANFNSVVLNAPIAMGANCSLLTISGGLTFGAGGSISTGASFCQTLIFSGTQTIGGTGTITLNAGSMAVTGTSATTTFGPGVTLTAGGSNTSFAIGTGNTLNNQGTIRSSAPAAYWSRTAPAPCRTPRAARSRRQTAARSPSAERRG
ncbi:MAG: hypothetical protein QM783_12530 [Phycisphaerales bacterium]